MTKTPLQTLQLSSYLSGGNAAYIEALYDEYLQNPHAVAPDWQAYFKSLVNNQLSNASQVADISHHAIQEQFKALAKLPRFAATTASAAPATKQEAVDELIQAYRCYGHLNAKLDPLGSMAPTDPRLTLEHYQLSPGDLKQSFNARDLVPGKTQATLQEIIQTLQQLYCGFQGIEYSYITDESEHAWIRAYVEQHSPQFKLTAEVKRSILQKLIAADGLEKFLDTKYKGQKRFSGEGSDSLIPMLDLLTKHARAAQVHEVVMCMAHRGRLNVLINIMGQSPAKLFKEFEGNKDYGMTTGDVKYHLGFANNIPTVAGPIHLSLAFNPSHLEVINPVIMGSVRARQDREPAAKRQDYALSVVMHGDAAFSGQGVVMETFSMSKTRAYNVGGSIHIIINNQVGFTTSNPEDLRSSRYCSDLAKMIEAPVIHVNGDHPEEAVRAIIFALDYRMKFHKDVVIDLVGYRRHGHQEVDEPRATQPLMYQLIDKHPTPRELYAEQLIAENICTAAEVKQWINDYRDCLDRGDQVIETLPAGQNKRVVNDWTPYLGQSWTTQVVTTVPKNELLALGEKITQLPPEFQLQRNVQMIFDARKKMTQGEIPLDWGYAETLAYASLLVQGHTVRLSGEDVRRGTFFHRHAAVFDQKTGAAFMPLSHLDAKQAPIYVYDSLLSEAGTLGFECGYAAADPNPLVLWEAQYGDFVNGAQVIIDQFISSGFQKWNRLCGLVMLLPHGHEGAGPEHTSARLERFLQLCAQDNIQVCVPTTPAQMFHLLRRQILRPVRIPLVVMSPKSVLRHKLAVSTLEELAEGQLQLVIPEIDELNVKDVKRVVICSGKVYYDLLTKRRELQQQNIAIIRVEQLYPFPYDELRAAVAVYPNAETIIWCQEEPKNQGAWFCTRHRVQQCLPVGKELVYVGRASMAAPSVGYSALHQKEQVALVNAALVVDGDAINIE